MTKINNLHKNSFNQDFCAFLEYHLSRTFKNSTDKTIQLLWCDGIDHEPLNRQLNNDDKTLETKAWIGIDGQEEYRMTIKLGTNSLNKYVKGLDLTSTVPSETSTNWININANQRIIKLTLN